MLPNTDEMLARIGGAEIFSKLDLKDGYWQVSLTEDASKLTTFNSPIGRFSFTLLPVSVQPTKERSVPEERVNKHADGAIVLFYDMLIFAKDEEEHMTSGS